MQAIKDLEFEPPMSILISGDIDWSTKYVFHVKVVNTLLLFTFSMVSMVL